jgi:hypothetical protein
MHTYRSTIIVKLLIGLFASSIMQGELPLRVQNPLSPVPPVIEIPLKIRINRSSIEHHRNDIAHRVFWNKVARYGLGTATVGASVYFLYRWLKNKPHHKDVKKPSGLPKELAELKEIPENQPIRAAVINQMINRGNQITNILTKNKAIFSEATQNRSWLQNFFKNFVKPACTMGLTAVGSALIQEYLKQFFFQEEDIVWFVETSTNLEYVFDPVNKNKFCEQLKIHAASIDARHSLPDYKASFLKMAFEESLRDLVYQLEHVIGFMEFLLRDAMQQEYIIPSDLQGTPAFLEYVVNDFCEKAEKKLTLQEDAGPLTGDVLSFADEIKQIIDSYRNFSSKITRAQGSASASLL